MNPRRWPKKIPNQDPLTFSPWDIALSLRGLKGTVFGLVLALLVLGHTFGAEWPVPSPERPDQLWSRVNYDPGLTDPFFGSNEWSYPWYIVKHPDGTFEDTTSGKRPEKEPPHLKHTAKCFSTFTGEDHLIRYCKAKLTDANMIDLFIEEENASFVECLRVHIREGMFTCDFNGLTDIPPLKGFTSTTKRQALTLEKKVYRKGDAIKGKVWFECVDKMTNPKCIEEYGHILITIKVYGVFKTIVE